MPSFAGASDWPQTAVKLSELIERVIHHADVVSIEGKSYRLREADAAAKAGTKAKTKK